MSIKELLESGHNVTLNVTPADLKEFALAIAEEVKAAITPSEPPDVKLTCCDARCDNRHALAVAQRGLPNPRRIYRTKAILLEK